MEHHYYAIHNIHKGYWDVCPWTGVGWTQDINKATLFRDDTLNALPWKPKDAIRFVRVK